METDVEQDQEDKQLIIYNAVILSHLYLFILILDIIVYHQELSLKTLGQFFKYTSVGACNRLDDLEKQSQISKKRVAL